MRVILLVAPCPSLEGSFYYKRERCTNSLRVFLVVFVTTKPYRKSRAASGVRAGDAEECRFVKLLGRSGWLACRDASYVLCFVVLVAQGCSFGGSSSRHGINHVVKRGENLFRIGKAYGIPYEELAAVNRISNPDLIKAGDRIFIPGATRQLPVEIITPANAVMTRRPDRKQRRQHRLYGFIWPIRGQLTSGFGPRGNSFHDGIDIAASSGTPIHAAQSGRVIYSDSLRGYGNLIIIRHLDGFASVYAHNRKNLAREGQRISKGQVIAEVGSTGRVTGPHLHFEIRRNNVATNPLYYLP